MKHTITCLECGCTRSSRNATASFCSDPCRHAFNNRRATRGAALYDLWMINRYERPAAKLFKVMNLMTALGQQYREEDAKRGAGHARKSWLDVETLLAAKPWLRAKVALTPTADTGISSPNGQHVFSDQEGHGPDGPDRPAAGD